MLHHKLQLYVRYAYVFSQIKIHHDEIFLLYWINYYRYIIWKQPNDSLYKGIYEPSF